MQDIKKGIKFAAFGLRRIPEDEARNMLGTRSGVCKLQPTRPKNYEEFLFFFSTVQKNQKENNTS